ncbi:endonuclease/exonuclease/phosphatase family protein [Streptomyces sp. MMS24-I29]|uniref:endonuclease/exonuclease/phosphatase family protein n=1 Tax=Streptomyces sp. MMS24-I29 TaxID=3351480 RepID=UPI003C7E0F04
MELTVVVQNLGMGGLQDGDGNPQDRWPQLAERIGGAAERVDVVLLQEATGWDSYGHKQLARAMRDLDLDAAPLPPSRSGIGTALLYRREVLGRWVRHNADFGLEVLHGIAVTTFDVGLPAPLSFMPVHFTPMAAEQALIEANYAATRCYKYGPYAVLGGDINYAPASSRHPLPDYSEMRPYNLGSRTLLPDADADFDPAAAPEPDRRVARKLAQNGYVDAAWALYEERGDEELLRRTATDDRIDQLWVSAPLRDTVVDYAVLDTPAGASDHHGLVVRLDLDQAAADNVWEYR